MLTLTMRANKLACHTYQANVMFSPNVELATQQLALAYIEPIIFTLHLILQTEHDQFRWCGLRWIYMVCKEGILLSVFVLCTSNVNY